MTREAARESVRLEALETGADDDTVDAIVASAMSAFEDLGQDPEAWDDLVESVIQGHLAP